MLKKITLFTAAFFVLSASYSWAGFPMSDTITCPLGDETIAVTQTASCSTMGRTLSLKPVTSCDFVTNVPVCPSNKLPIFREFSEDELAALPKLIESPEFNASAAISRFYSSYWLEKSLKPEDLESQFFLLQRGLWDTASLYENKPYMDDYFKAFKAFAESDVDENFAFWYGAASYAAMEIGAKKTANTYLSKMKEIGDPENAYLSTYMKALTYCASAAGDDELCGPFVRIRQHQDATQRP